MNILEEIQKELDKLCISNKDVHLQEIQNKNGIYVFRVLYKNNYYVFRVLYKNNYYVLKYFLNDEYTREIKNYLILKELDIPTIKVFGYTYRSLLLEDLEKSKDYRLGKNQI
ncbi:MAG TPA: hypothetical protein GXX63_05610 [Tissierellia bacterium]|nr:hypothetical protein [Tissierellia bacterium]